MEWRTLQCSKCSKCPLFFLSNPFSFSKLSWLSLFYFVFFSHLNPIPAVDCWWLWPQHGTVPYSDGAVGDHGRSPVHVQRPAQHQRWSPQHPAEQDGHQHQPGRHGNARETHREGDRPSNFVVSSFFSRFFQTTCKRLHITLINRTSLLFLPARRRVVLKCSGAPCQTVPALWFSSVAVTTCPTFTGLPWANSTTPPAIIRSVLKSSDQIFRHCRDSSLLCSTLLYVEMLNLALYANIISFVCKLTTFRCTVTF